MVHKPLPSALIFRLRVAERKISPRLGAMKNIDSRWSKTYGRKPRNLSEMNTTEPGFRVRSMNVSRNFPGAKLVLKRPHGSGKPGRDLSAQEVIDGINRKVKLFNEKFHPTEFELRGPISYAIGRDLIAMAETDAPTLERLFREKLRKDAGLRKTLLHKGRILPIRQSMFWDVEAEFGFGNVLFFREKGKIVLVVAPDWL